MWYVYIVECVDKSLYTGISIDINRRIEEHNGIRKGGAKSIKGKRPVFLKYFETYKTRSEALKREKEIKGWRREKKLILINSEKNTIQLSK